jgi:hypothetical protein
MLSDQKLALVWELRLVPLLELMWALALMWELQVVPL